MDFTSFEEGVHEGIFNIPHRCNETEMLSLTNPPSVGCVGRSTMIKRAQNWVDHHVPYSQSGTYEGYRTDCSGNILNFFLNINFLKAMLPWPGDWASLDSQLAPWVEFLTRSPRMI